MNFGEILSKAWKIVWKYKVLWIFGILASLGGGGGGGGGGSSSYSTNGNNGNFFNNNQFNLPPEWQQGFNQFARTMAEIPWYVWVAIGLGVLLLILVVIVLSTIGKIGLIHGTRLADDGVTALPFGSLLSQSFRYFWRVFLFDLLTGLALFVVILILIVPLLLAGVLTMGIGLLCLIPFICLLVPAIALIGVVLQQGVIAIVVENVGVFEGLKLGWNVFKKNFWNVVLMALVLGIGSAIVGIIIALPLLIVLVPPIISLVSNGFNYYEGITNTLLISGVLCCVIYPFYLVFQGILTAYVQSAWTLTYRRLTSHSEPVLEVEPPAPLETV